MPFPSVSAPHFEAVSPPMDIFIALLRKNQSIHPLVFLLLELHVIFTKEHTWYTLTNKYILAQKLRRYKIPKIQFTDHMKLKKKEYQSVYTLVLLRRGVKIPMAYSQPMH